MLSERSVRLCSTPLRSGKDNSTNGINNFISGIIGYLRRNLGYNFIKNADIQGFCSWIAWGRDGFLHCIIVQFPGAKGQSFLSFLGLKWLLYGSLGRLFWFPYKFQGVGMQSLWGLFFGLCGVSVIPGAILGILSTRVCKYTGGLLGHSWTILAFTNVMVCNGPGGLLGSHWHQ